jgi:hypothetical protein
LFIGDGAEHPDHRMTPLSVIEVHPLINCGNEFRSSGESVTADFIITTTTTTFINSAALV